MRVLICLDSLGPGGKERQVVELVKGLARRPGIECRLICLEKDDFHLEELAHLSIPVEFGLRRVRWDVSIYYNLYRTIRRYRPQLIHTYELMTSFFVLPIAKLMNIPLINGSIRNAFSGGGWRWRLERALLRMSDYRVANSYAGLRSRGFSTEGKNNIVIHNGFDCARVARALSDENRQQDIRVPGARTVGMVAGFSKYKDYSTFIRAAREISGRRKDVVFVTVGNGEKLQECKELAAGLESIRFLGKRKDVVDIVATFEIGVMATYTEGISNSIMEYMALRKPVVATDGGGTRELVVDGETGFLVPPGNATALAARIEYLLDHPAIARRMGEAGEARLISEFSIARMVAETVKLYESAVKSSRAHPRSP